MNTNLYHVTQAYIDLFLKSDKKPMDYQLIMSRFYWMSLVSLLKPHEAKPNCVDEQRRRIYDIPIVFDDDEPKFRFELTLE